MDREPNHAFATKPVAIKAAAMAGRDVSQWRRRRRLDSRAAARVGLAICASCFSGDSSRLNQLAEVASSGSREEAVFHESPKSAATSLNARRGGAMSVFWRILSQVRITVWSSVEWNGGLGTSMGARRACSSYERQRIRWVRNCWGTDVQPARRARVGGIVTISPRDGGL